MNSSRRDRRHLQSRFGAAADQEELVRLLLIVPRLLSLIGGELALPKVRNNFALLPNLCVTRLLLSSSLLEHIELGHQSYSLFSACGLQQCGHVQFCAGYAGRRLLQELSSCTFDFAIERFYLDPYLGHLHCHHSQALQFSFFQAFAQPQQRSECEVKWHRVTLAAPSAI
jgi:hypothetical protein